MFHIDTKQNITALLSRIYCHCKLIKIIYSVLMQVNHVYIFCLFMCNLNIQSLNAKFVLLQAFLNISQMAYNWPESGLKID